jgi:hypothetical protein
MFSHKHTNTEVNHQPTKPASNVVMLIEELQKKASIINIAHKCKVELNFSGDKVTSIVSVYE